jgi:hypothetical protein
MEPVSSGQGGADPPEFGDVATSSTFVYRFDAKTYERVVRDLDASGLLGELRQPAADDFEMMGTSVLGDFANRSVLRRQLAIELSPDRDRPIFADIQANPIIVVSTCLSERTVGVTINFFLGSADADQLIALAHSMYGRPSGEPVLRGGPSPDVDGSGQGRSIQQAQFAIAEQLSIVGYNARNHFRCVEIRRIGEERVAREAIRRYELPLYGVLSADEGWRWASRELAAARMSEAWATRDFNAVVGAGETALMVNLRPVAYANSQNEYFSRYFGHTEPYFSHRYTMAGLDHGQFLAQELCAYRQCVVDDLQHRLSGRRVSQLSVSLLGGIREQARRSSLDRSLIEDLFRLRDHPPTELNALVIVVEATSGLPQRLASLRQEVRAVEAEDQSLYLYIVNRILVRVAWISVIVALVSALVAIVAAVP